MKSCIGNIKANEPRLYGYTIDVAWSVPDGSVHSVLIPRQPAWTGWNPKHEDLHQIGRRNLVRYGRAPRLFAATMNSNTLRVNSRFSPLYTTTGLNLSCQYADFDSLLVTVGFVSKDLKRVARDRALERHSDLKHRAQRTWRFCRPTWRMR